MKIINRLFLLPLLLLAFACNKQYTCPAFASYFIHDEKVRENMFSYFSTSDSSSEASADNLPFKTNAINTDNMDVPSGSGESKNNSPNDVQDDAAKGTPKGGWDVKYHDNGIIGPKRMKNGYAKLMVIPMKFVPVMSDAAYRDTLSQPGNLAADSTGKL